MSHWKSYESCMSAAKRSRQYAVIFANHNDWARAFAHAATAKTAQAKADEYFERYLNGRALDNACNITHGFDPDMGISVGDLTRDAKDPHDIRS